MVGSLTSGDLSGPRPSDLAALDGRGFGVTLNPGAEAATVALSAPLASLEGVAAQIESDVRGNTTSPTNPRTAFTCTVEGKRLVLRAGVKAANASVAVTAGTSPNDAAAPLKLIGNDATARTGAQAFMATFSNTSSSVLAGGADGGFTGRGCNTRGCCPN